MRECHLDSFGTIYCQAVANTVKNFGLHEMWEFVTSLANSRSSRRIPFHGVGGYVADTPHLWVWLFVEKVSWQPLFLTHSWLHLHKCMQ
jgi:hypothetical protein